LLQNFLCTLSLSLSLDVVRVVFIVQFRRDESAFLEASVGGEDFVVFLLFFFLLLLLFCNIIIIVDWKNRTRKTTETRTKNGRDE